MSARGTLTPELRAEVLWFEDDLRKRIEDLPDVQKQWRSEYDAARDAERTAATWQQWSDERITLAAVAWVLTTVFIRFCEDNALVKPVWISGPRSREALDAQQHFLIDAARTNPDVTDREWLLEAVNYLKSLPATAGLVDEDSPMWLVSPSGDAASRLLAYWRERDEDRNLLRNLTDPKLDTRFLGDLYQEISEDAKKRYALLQTPVFVEEFILDRTLEPALNERPLEGFKLIDPTCGSGHFLLGGFQRLLDRWHKKAPAMDERERVQAALDSVYGVDINPFAVAIARFRLTTAALQACALTSLEEAPAFMYHLACGDSLLHGLDQGELDLGPAFSADRVAANFAYGTENLEALRSLLRNGQYDVVVGNPPYIEVKDGKLRALYRRLYSSCKGGYVLSVPFMEKFFTLASRGERGGIVGQITSNSFAQREFGQTLIEKYLSTIDLVAVINAEGAWIRGHNMDGTPTVILVGRNRPPVTGLVRAILSKGIRESGREPDGRGPYWRSMIDHLDDAEFDNEWISVRDLPRESLSKHPWSLVGGGIRTLIDTVGAGRPTLGERAARVGFYGDSHADEIFFLPSALARRWAIPDGVVCPAARGASVRDWVSVRAEVALLPYDESKRLVGPEQRRVIERLYWPWRTTLWSRKVFDGSTYREAGNHWLSWHQLPRDEKCAPQTIAYAEIASDCHFVLNEGESVFNRTAPIIKLPANATDGDHWNLVLNFNSSLACCWMRDQSKPKGGAAGASWSRTHQFNGTRLKRFPLAGPPSLRISESIRRLAEQLDRLANDRSFDDENPPIRTLMEARQRAVADIRRKLIAWQEELDWEIYKLYGLVDEDLTYVDDDLPAIEIGQRAFEISLARGSHPVGEASGWLEEPAVGRTDAVMAGWPESYQSLVARRMAAIENLPMIALVEVPDNKRRWSPDLWRYLNRRVLREWCLDRLENPSFWLDPQKRPMPKSVAVLADDVARDSDLSTALELLEGRPGVPLVDTLSQLMAELAMPYLTAERMTESGLRKHGAWRETWDHQRREDAQGLGKVAPAPAPPTYAVEDFRESNYFGLRGRFDLPRERFILYPGAGREGDRAPVLGWAGWDHAQQALALGNLLIEGEQQGWSDERLLPLVAGLAEVLPWVQQWHSDYDPAFGGSPAEFLGVTLDTYMVKLGATRQTLRDWRPPAPTRGRKRKA